MSKIAGRLENWVVHHHPDVPEYIIWGHVYEVVNHELREGEWIHTSGILKSNYPVEDLKSGDTIQTRNSLYQLGKRLIDE